MSAPACCRPASTLRVISLLPSIVLMVLLFTHPTLAQPQLSGDRSRPNLVFIVTDDQGIDAIQGKAWPNDLNCITPNLDRLSSQGRIFGHARSNPLCSPTRACLMTGRAALQTGVVTALGPNLIEPKLSALQTYEYTIAEMLTKVGYETVFIDKWHLAVTDDQQPDQQGFATVELLENYLGLDDPIEIGDEHIVRMTDFAVTHARQANKTGKPVALMYCTSDPHDRTDKTGRDPLGWWKVDESLLPSGEVYYQPNPDDDTERDRFRAVVEALDTEIGRLLFQLGIIDHDGRYRPKSRTVVFFMSDNGTAGRILDRPENGKGSLLDGGIRVPFFVFGHNVPEDGKILGRLIHSMDIFDTVADIVQASPVARKGLPRQSVSFADDIGWGVGGSIEREYVISSRAPFQSYGPMIAIVGKQYKLICGGGSPGLDPISTNHFYDLQNDPLELTNLLDIGLNADQRLAYLAMRDVAVDYWGASVSDLTAITVDIPMTHFLSLNSDNQTSSPAAVGHIDPGTGDAIEARVFVRFDIDSIPNRLPVGKTIDDVVAAQIVVLHDSDSNALDETDTGRIRVLPMKRNWMKSTPSWDFLKSAYLPIVLGKFDPPPHIVPRRVYSRQSPISFGHHDALLDAVRVWLDHSKPNFGVVLVAEPFDHLPGDQQILWRTENAFLRLTLKPE